MRNLNKNKDTHANSGRTCQLHRKILEAKTLDGFVWKQSGFKGGQMAHCIRRKCFKLQDWWFETWDWRALVMNSRRMTLLEPNPPLQYSQSFFLLADLGENFCEASNGTLVFLGHWTLKYNHRNWKIKNSAIINPKLSADPWTWIQYIHPLFWGQRTSKTWSTNLKKKKIHQMNTKSQYEQKKWKTRRISFPRHFFQGQKKKRIL